MISSSGFFWNKERGYQFKGSEVSNPDIVFYFFDKNLSKNNDIYQLVKERFPNSKLFGCSTSGPILDDDIYMDSFTGMCMSFEKTKLKLVQSECPSQDQSFKAGKELVEKLLGDGLTHIWVVSDGMTVHGTEFMNGANSVMPKGVHITGGMSSDSFEFKETLTGVDGKPKSGQACAVGFYGKNLKVGSGAEGGWDVIGLERIVTKSEGNVLYELDGLPALDLYKEYLGPDADKLPASGLLFPLSIRKTSSSKLIVRTIDIVDEKTKALRFTGDIPQGYIAQFMKGNFDHLVKGARNAAAHANENASNDNGVALAVSCIGRQLLMGQRTSDELEAIGRELGDTVPLAGFYSNGEYSLAEGGVSALHNQTMTMTVFRET